MLELIITIISEIFMSLQLTRVLEFVSLGVVIMLLGSPGAIGTILGVSAKLGMYKHMKEQEQQES